VVTINSSDLDNKSLDYKYKVSSSGEVVTVNLLGNLKGSYLKDIKTKKAVIRELIEQGFDNIPAELTGIELKNILEFSMSEISKNLHYGKIYPFSIEKNETGDIKIVLLMHNSYEHPLSLGNIPVKLKDANEKIIFAGFIDFSKEISPKKTGVYCVKIDKEKLKEDSMDLKSWNITFEP
jgi:SLAP domain-containing protein